MACTAFAGVAFPSPAVANSLVGITGASGCSGGLNMMDPHDSTINYKKEALTTGTSNAVSWVMANKINTTDLSSALTSSSPDVIYNDGAYPDGFCNVTNWGTGATIGKAICETKSGSTCTRHRVYIAQEYIDAHSSTNERKLLCHETGHVIGISHNYHSSSFNSCLRTPSSNGTTSYSSHEINDMINFQW